MRRASSLQAVVSLAIGALFALLLVGAVTLAYNTTSQRSDVVGPKH